MTKKKQIIYIYCNLYRDLLHPKRLSRTNFSIQFLFNRIPSTFEKCKDGFTRQRGSPISRLCLSFLYLIKGFTKKKKYMVRLVASLHKDDVVFNIFEKQPSRLL